MLLKKMFQMRPAFLCILTLLLLFPLSCSDSEGESAGGAGGLSGGAQLGAPCEVESHCAPGLICDGHNGRGSCQEPHSH